MVALPRKASGRTISSASPLAAIYSAAGGMWKRPTGFTAKIPTMSVVFIMALQTFCMLATQKAPPTPSTLHATPVLPETPLVASSTIAERDAVSLSSNSSRLAFSVALPLEHHLKGAVLNKEEPAPTSTLRQRNQA